MRRQDLIDKRVNWAGDTWLVGNVGAEHEGKIYCHLWSETRTLLTQRNGRKIPVQSCDWLPLKLLEQA